MATYGMYRSIKCFVLTLLSVAGMIWGATEAYTYFTDEALKELLGSYWWLVYYGLPLICGVISSVWCYRKPGDPENGETTSNLANDTSGQLQQSGSHSTNVQVGRDFILNPSQSSTSDNAADNRTANNAAITLCFDALKCRFFRKYNSFDVQDPDAAVLQFHLRLNNGYNRKIAFTKYYVEIDPLLRNGKMQVSPYNLAGEWIIIDHLKKEKTQINANSSLCRDRSIVSLGAYDSPEGTLSLLVPGWNAPNSLCVLRCTLFLETDDGKCVRGHCNLLRYDWVQRWLGERLEAECNQNRAGRIHRSGMKLYCWIGTEWEIQGISQSKNFCHLVVYPENPDNRTLYIKVSETSGVVRFDGEAAWREEIDLSSETFHVSKKPVTIHPHSIRGTEVEICVNLNEKLEDGTRIPIGQATFEPSW
jgi:hypothetical protein